jgi:hypothetical protein
MGDNEFSERGELPTEKPQVRVGNRFKPIVRFGLFGVEKLRFAQNNNRSVDVKNRNRRVRFSV